MSRTVKWAAVPIAASLLLSACANSSDGGSDGAPSKDVASLPVQTTLDVPADAVRPAGDGKAECDPSTTIAFVGAVTGPNAQLGVNIFQGVDLAIKQHNDNNPKCQVRFKKFDTEGDPNKATGPVTQVVNEKDVVGVVGPAFSGESKATGGIFADAGLVTITPSATNPGLSTNGWPTFFRGLGNDSVQGPAVADFAKKLSLKKVYVVQDDSDYGIGLGEAATKGLGSLLAGTDKVTTGQKDFSATISKIQNAKPDAVFYSGYYAEAAPLDQQLVAKGYEGILIGPDGVKDQQFIKQAGSASANGYFTCPCLPGELIPEFAKEYEAAFGNAAGTYSIEAYDSATVLLAGIDAGKTTRPGLLDFVKTYDGQGFSKRMKWDDKGELADLPVFGYKAEKGKIVSLGQIS